MTAVTTSASRSRRGEGLPAEVTSFVGRRHEVAEVRRLLAASRAVTLTGTGGVGKTRLALRVGQEVRRAFRDGVWLVELAALPGPALLAETVAEALRIRDRSGAPPLEAVCTFLRGRQVLLILDNCEHVLQACATLADTLLRAAGELRVLATSREPLGIGGEHVVPVAPLELPGCDEPVPSAQALLQGEAVRLFAERARAVLPEFAVTEDNREVICRIVRRLEGLPLGIELAAVRLRALSAQQLLDRLDDRFRLLTSGSRAVLPRHQTLRALIDWSYGLCSEQERLLWGRVSVFAGGLDLEAAEAVCAGGAIARRDVLDLVSGLVDKCVLTREDQQGVVRYRMLETLREYGRDRLAACGGQGELLGRHRGYYRELAARARAELFGPGQVAWFRRLRAEHANLRAALESYTCVPGGAEDGLSMATDLLYHWISSYYLAEGRGWLERGLAGDFAPGPVRARALWSAAWLALIRADVPAASALLAEARDLGRRLGDDSVSGYAALFEGMAAMYGGRAGQAVGLYGRALECHRRTGDAAGQALALIRLSLAQSFLGRSREAVAAGEECLAVCRAHGEGWHRAYMLMALGVEVWRQGDLARATELERESLVFNRSLGDLLGIGMDVEVLAWIAGSAGRHRRAARLLGVSRTVWGAVGAPLSGYGHLAGYHRECADRTREALGAAVFEAEVAKGAALPQGQALAFALQEERPAAAEPADDGGAVPLTRREREIAALVAEGLTNKEIAAALVIAQRTAEGHIEHILAKLGFHSRAQIAVWAGEHLKS